MPKLEKPEVVELPNGRLVTKSVKWWYDATSSEGRSQLYCIHNKNLLQGCNDCVNKKGWKTK